MLPHHEAFKKRKDASGLCLRCSNPRAANRLYCLDCLAKRCEESKRAYYANLEYKRKIARESQAKRRRNPVIRELLNERQRERYRLNPDLARQYDFRRRYGITINEYDALASTQHGRCAICDKVPVIGKRAMGKAKQPPRLCVDHDHKTGHVRGLLCHWCNTNIVAGIEKSGASLRRIAAYLGVEL